MAHRDVNLVGGFGHSGGKDNPDVIANIGTTGTNFSGTFIGRMYSRAYDFVASVYTNKDDVLYIIPQAVDEYISLEISRQSPQSFLFIIEGEPIGTISYDSSSGDLTIVGTKVWFQGTLSGMYVQGG